jgi:GrpB-like predicted nucleotidyltransferase (UPF0157 family)
VTVRFRRASELWPLADRAFQRHSREIRSLIPAAEVEHVGATAVPGSLTTGDVDLLVRVPGADFRGAATALRRRYDVDQPANWTETFASFAEAQEGDLPVGVQLVVAGSRVDAAFVSLRRAFRTRPDLLERANDLKLRHADGDADTYARAKQAFLEALLRDLDPARYDRGTWPWPERAP